MQWPSADANVLETILARRSVRSYREGNLERKVIGTLLEAAVRAPTAVHEEPWGFVVVQDRELLHGLSERAKPLFAEELRRTGAERTGHGFDVFASPDFNIFYDAGTLIVICARAISPFVAADCWLAAENLILAACAVGLGTCVIGSAVSALNVPEVKTQLGIPGEAAIAPTRHEPRVLAWH